jgi:hypothetical protein
MALVSVASATLLLSIEEDHGSDRGQVTFYLGYTYPWGYEETSYINENETQEP